jgi:hypothetical protein
VPRGVLEEDAIIGREFVQQMVGKIDIRVFPTPNGMLCDSCDSVISMCRCAMKPIAAGTPPQSGGPPPGRGGPPQQPYNRMAPPSPGPLGPNPTR